jgi:hypothetical protein
LLPDRGDGGVLGWVERGWDAGDDFAEVEVCGCGKRRFGR